MARLFVTLTVLFCLVAPAYSAPTPSQEPLEITAEKLVSEQKKNRVVFSGDVVARQEDMTVYCQTLTIDYNGQGGIQKITARRQVRLVQGDRIATGDSGIYHQAGRTMELIGNAQAHQGKNVVKGDRIKVYLDEDRSEVHSKDGGRVRAIFFPKKASQ